MANIFRGKDKPAFKLQDIAKFPWEKDAPQEEIADEQIAAFYDETAAWDKAYLSTESEEGAK